MGSDSARWRGAVHFRLNQTSAIYASWPFGVVTLEPEDLHARVQPRWAEMVALFTGTK